MHSLLFSQYPLLAALVARNVQIPVMTPMRPKLVSELPPRTLRSGLFHEAQGSSSR